MYPLEATITSKHTQSASSVSGMAGKYDTPEDRRLVRKLDIRYVTKNLKYGLTGD